MRSSSESALSLLLLLCAAVILFCLCFGCASPHASNTIPDAYFRWGGCLYEGFKDPTRMRNHHQWRMRHSIKCDREHPSKLHTGWISVDSIPAGERQTITWEEQP